MNRFRHPSEDRLPPEAGREALSPFLRGQFPRMPWLWLLLLLPAGAGIGVGGGWRFAGVVLVAIVLVIWVSTLVRRRRLLAANGRDLAEAGRIHARIQEASRLDVSGRGDDTVKVFAGLDLLDIQRYPASQIEAAVDGWLNHRLGLPSEAAWVPGRRTGTTGMQTDGWSLGSLLGGGATIAEFSEPEDADEPPTATTETAATGAETAAQAAAPMLRAVIPPAWWAAECVNEAARRVAAPLLAGTHAHDALVAAVGQAVGRFPFPADEPAAQLAALLRTPADGRPTFSVTGSVLGPGVILAAAVASTAPATWNLFPLILVAALGEIADRHRPTYRVTGIYGTRKTRLVIMETEERN